MARKVSLCHRRAGKKMQGQMSIYLSFAFAQLVGYHQTFAHAKVDDIYPSWS